LGRDDGPSRAPALQRRGPFYFAWGCFRVFVSGHLRCTAEGYLHCVRGNPSRSGVRAIEGRFPQNRHPPEAKKPLRKAGLCGFDGSQPLASRGFGR